MIYYLFPIVILFVIVLYIEVKFSAKIQTMIQEEDWLNLAKMLGFDGVKLMNQRYQKLCNTSYLYFLYIASGFHPYVLVGVSGCVIYRFKKDYWSKKRFLKKQLHKIRFEFPIWLRQMEILLQVNTIMKALEYSIVNAPVILQSDLKELVERLKQNPNQIESYTNFMNNYPFPDINRTMKMFYRYSIIGQKDAYQQLNRLIVLSAKMLREERNNYYSNHLAIYQWWGIVPLFGVTVLFLMIMINYLLQMMKGGII